MVLSEPRTANVDPKIVHIRKFPKAVRYMKWLFVHFSGFFLTASHSVVNKQKYFSHGTQVHGKTGENPALARNREQGPKGHAA